MTDTPLKQAVLLMNTVALIPLSAEGTAPLETQSDSSEIPPVESVVSADRLDKMMLPLPDEATYFYHQRLIKHNREHPNDSLEALSENTLMAYLERQIQAAKAQGKTYDSAKDGAFIRAVHQLSNMWRLQQELIRLEERRQEIEINTAAFAKRVADGFWMPETPNQTARQYRASFERAKKENPNLISLESITADDIQDMSARLARAVCSTNPYVAERCRETIMRLYAAFQIEKAEQKNDIRQATLSRNAQTTRER